MDKNLAIKLPRDRPLSEVEAMFSVSLDYDNNKEVTISGYAGRWGWSRKRVKNFLEKVGVEIVYPDHVKNNRNKRGHIGLHKRDIKGTYKEQIKIINSKSLREEGNIKGTYKEHKRDIKGSTTINPNPNPNPIKNNICGKYPEAFERWWNIYPKRNGRRVGKANAALQFKKIPESDWKELKRATENYAKECNGLPKDAERFLKKDFWKDYIHLSESSGNPQPRNGEKRERSWQEIADAMEPDGLSIKLNFDKEKDDGEKDCDHGLRIP